MAAGGQRCAVGPSLPAFLRTRARRAWLLHCPDDGPAELATAAQHRAPRGAGGHHRLDGTRLRHAGRTRRIQGLRGLLGAGDSPAKPALVTRWGAAPRTRLRAGASEALSGLRALTRRAWPHPPGHAAHWLTRRR